MKRKHDFAVSLTIIGGIATILAATLWVKQANLGRRQSTAVARFRDVGSVRIGTPVVIRGMRAGRVEAMELDEGGFVRVRLSLSPEIALPQQPVVVLNESSLFGEWQATITTRDAVGRDEEITRQLTDASLGDGVLPGAVLPDIARLTAVAGGIAGDVASVAERVRVAFDEPAARELRTSIHNFAELSTALAKTVREQSANLTNLSAGFKGGVESLQRSAEGIRVVAQRFDSSTARGEVRRIVDDAAERLIVRASGELRRCAAYSKSRLSDIVSTKAR